MSDFNACPQCGTRLPASLGGDLCPHCLFGLALSSSEDVQRPDVDAEAPTTDLPRGTLAPGAILGERYRIRKLLGRGGMGEVWRAYDLKLRVDVALKSLHVQWLSNERMLETLRQEVRLARQVISPNVCRVFDLIELDGSELVTMEYVDGMTLLSVLSERGPLELEEARGIASQLLAGLESIHDAGLIHRDLKPENVMLTRAGRVVIMDFGIAKGLSDGQTGTVAGTPGYMAPEQLHGGGGDARADLYSVGVVLAEMVAPGGLSTFEAREAIWQDVHHDPPRVAETPWAGVIRKAVARSPEHRWPSASALARALEEVTLRVAGAETLHPYPGLSSFTAHDAEYFFGREYEIEAVWKKLRQAHLLALIGPSGAGKSSFLRAGLLPAMPPGWAAIVATPGNRPIGALARALAPELAGDAVAVEELTSFDDPDVAVSLVERWRKRHEQALIVVDQFEELFTLNPPETQQRFAELLGRLALEADAHVVVSMRDDFLFRCHDHEALAPLFSELTPLGPPTGAALRRAIVQPALKCGYRFEDDALVDDMLREVEGERGALPMLAFGAAQLWSRRDREQGLLTRGGYEQTGGVAGALAQHAEATLERIGQERASLVRELFRNLVTAQGTRAVRDREALISVFAEGEERNTAGSVLDALIDARLLTSYDVPADDEQRRERHRIEIVHESLLSNWPRLVRWQTQDADGAQLRDQVRQAAQMWEQHSRSDDLLWTGTAFQEFELWRERYPGGLSEQEEAFASAMAVRAARRRRRRQTAVAAIVAAALGVAGVTSLLWKRSEAARSRATLEASRAVASELVAFGRLELDSNPTAALAYATKSLEIADRTSARDLALQALWRGPTAFVLDEQLTWKAKFSPDGEWLVTGGSRGNLGLRSRRGGPVRNLSAGEGNWVPLAVTSPPYRLVAQSSRMRAGEVQLWSLDPAELLRRWPVNSVAWEAFFGVRKGRFLVYEAEAGFKEAIWKSWTLERPEPELLTQKEPMRTWLDSCYDELHEEIGFGPEGPDGLSLIDALRPLVSRDRPLGGPHGQVRTCAFTAQGDRLAALAIQGGVSIWRREAQRWVLERELPTAAATGSRAFSFSPDSSLLAVGANDQVLRIFDLASPPGAAPLGLRRGSAGNLIAATFDPLGQWLVSSEVNGTILWALGNRYPSRLVGHTDTVNDLAFAPDGRSLLTVSFDTTLRLWPLRPASGSEPKVLKNLGALLEVLELDPSGRFVLVTTAGGWHVLADLATFRIATLSGFTDGLYAGGFSPDGRWVAMGGLGEGDAVIRLYDVDAFAHESGTGNVKKFEATRTLDADDGKVILDLRFSPGGEILSAGGAGLRRWSVNAGTFEQLLDEPVARLAANGDGSLLFLRLGRKVLGDGPALLLRTSDGTKIPLTRHGDDIITGALDRAGTFVVTADTKGIVRVGTIDGAEPHLLLGHTGPIRTVAVSPDGRSIATGSDDGTIRLWPVPDLSQPPLHALPHDQLVARLRRLTNLRVVEDQGSSTGWKIEVGPFPGWSEVPTW